MVDGKLKMDEWIWNLTTVAHNLYYEMRDSCREGKWRYDGSICNNSFWYDWPTVEHKAIIGCRDGAWNCE